ncbi:McrB family protein [Chitinophaga agri]|uniref:AAA domain-containing protein n=1 Tax=Chitinophaga agri TaxID=2703787 RepID=A0A6B9ZMB4_9BACT|nr:AAA family ATPase [Chitinophaga agri]QHS62295.1 AAA domain-containing protein [Chitinophaga agri]
MKRARIYDVREGDIDYHKQLSPDKAFLFRSEESLPDSMEGDIVFIVDQTEKQAFYTIATDILCKSTHKADKQGVTFKYNNKTYSSTSGTRFRKYDILQTVEISAGWVWCHSLPDNPVVDLWNEQGDNPDRLKNVNELQKLFTTGPAFEQLDRYNIQVDIVDIPVNQSNIKMTMVTSSTHMKKKETISYEHPYRKLLMAIRTKPFVLLSGVSGTGKSWLARKIAYMTCADEALRKGEQPGNFEIVRVRPDWHDPDELLGYQTIIQGGRVRYHCTDVLRFIVKAWQYPHVPFILCLDEMNLAQIEHYFSDFLSVLETVRSDNGRIIYDAFISHSRVKQYSREDETFWMQLGLEGNDPLMQHFLMHGISIPVNLVVIGTVNIDATTRTLSARLLDRTMIIEMKRRDLWHDLTAAQEKWEYPETYEIAAWLRQPPLDRHVAYSRYPDIGMTIMQRLEKLLHVLDNSPFELSERFVHSTLVYCFLHNELAIKEQQKDDWLNSCLDEIICMKILVRISGDSNSCRPVLEKLMGETAYYPVSRRKVTHMLALLENNGYTSYW